MSTAGSNQPSSPYSSANPSRSAVTIGSPHSSPSPLVAAQGYTPKVSFDTLENPVASMFSYTLHVQSDGYHRARSTRVFLCAASPDESGSQALEWSLKSLVQDGDELVVFRGIDPIGRSHRRGAAAPPRSSQWTRCRYSQTGWTSALSRLARGSR